ncbi:hypothetical protein [Sanyastnella coralliicola]|uniref:hypothetical protein n=1 Tax=Sanyastnella coralliicola TaxID=3069118 RepID=UPI0027BA2B6D|nr:hypothetical protein [Longitalea sp. SCSIO 12813]
MTYNNQHLLIVILTQRPFRQAPPFHLRNGFTVLPEERVEQEKISAVKIRWGASS